ncbi:MAG: hypothetical protein MUD16_12245 [Desulfobacterales bacterium]|jgi:hypothetical protein|nr:hypothetical protein [Desulfobacterales bacterium]
MKITEFLAGLMEHRRDARKAEEGLLAAVETAAALVDPKIRWVSDYRRKLTPAVARTLEYADELIAKIPGPVDAHPERWDHDPVLRAVFSSPEELLLTFNSCPDVPEPLAAPADPRRYALLTMTRQERSVFGVQLEGDIVRRDVARTAVNFVDLRLVAPAAMEAETREHLRGRALAVLCATAMDRILALRSRAQELGEQRELLQIKLKIRESGRNGLSVLMCGSKACDAEMVRAQSALADITREIAATKAELGGPAECLEHVRRILAHPEEYLRVEPLRLRLSPLGFKVAAESTEPAAELELCEFKVREGLHRAAVFVHFTHRRTPA